MDATRFDRISKSLATEVDRRRVVRGLGAGVAALVAVALGRGNAAQANRSLCPEYCRNEGHAGRAFGQCVSACARAGGPPTSPPPPDETCIEYGMECDPEGGLPCCGDPNWVFCFDPIGDGARYECGTPV